jgi:peptidyl-prolyl cis-trans isomerase SurA
MIQKIAKEKGFTVRSLGAALIAASMAFAAACGGSSTGSGGGANEAAAKVNGTTIKMEDVDRGVKVQAQGQESRLSPLELTGARLQVLQTLIEQEVMYQKAEKEGVMPSEDDITAEINKQKSASGRSADQIAKDMADQGLTEAALREQVKRAVAIERLVDKITGKIEAPKDSEIEAFYNGNKDAFVKRKGVKLGAIVIDPTNAGEGDTTTDEVSAVAKGNEIIGKLRAGQDFATIARESSEDQTKFQGGDLGYMSQEQLAQTFGEQTAAGLMSPQLQIGNVINSRSQGKLFILKLQDRSDRDEALTLESPGVRAQVVESLNSSRKQLLAASYQAIAMNEAKIENFLAQRVVANPNELSGARPAGAMPSNANVAANSNANAAPANANTGTANAAAGASNANVGGTNTRPANTIGNANARPANANR